MASFGFVLLRALISKIGFDILEVSPLFSSLVAATVFLLGFLLNGVLSDYKESEKLPGELSTSMYLLAKEIKAIPIHTAGAQIQEELQSIYYLCASVIRWIKGEISTDQVMSTYSLTHDHSVKASAWLKDSTLKGRLMIEMGSILRIINRIEVIRETDFATIVYLLAYAAAGILCVGLTLIKNEQTSFYNNGFFLFSLSWILIFILHLINDLDNPFGFSDQSSAEDVDLTILELTQSRLQDICFPGSSPETLETLATLSDTPKSPHNRL
jgi:predicted membrane chloride channel (bestrophin family)